jgi:hypothetical protein
MQEELAVGMVAGAFSRLFTTPISNVVTRKQTAAMAGTKASQQTFSEIVEEIKKEKGILGLWSGYSATLVLTLNPAITFLLHETMLRLLVKRENRQNPGARITFILAAFSKGLASCVTYPFSLAKSRTQVTSKAPTTEKGTMEKKQNIFQMLLKIANDEGPLALYEGIEGEVLKGFFSHGLTMLVKERIHRVVIKMYYLVLRLLGKYPDALRKVKKVARSALVQTEEKVSQGVGAMHDVYHHAQETAKDLVDEYILVDNEHEKDS